MVATISVMALPLFLVYKATVGSQGYWGLMILNEVPVLHYFATRDILDAMIERHGLGGGAISISIPHSGLFGQTWIEPKAVGWRIKRVWFGKTDALLIDPDGVHVPLHIERDGDHRLVNATFDLVKLLKAGSVGAYLQLLSVEKAAEIEDLIEKLRFQTNTVRDIENDLETERTKRWEMIRQVFDGIALLGRMSIITPQN